MAGMNRRSLPMVAGFESLRHHTAPGILSQPARLSAAAADLVAQARTVEILRPYHGVTVHGDMSGDLGAAYPGDTPRPDLTIVTLAAVLTAAGRSVRVRDDNAEMASSAPPGEKPDLRLIKIQLATWQQDLAVAEELRRADPDVPALLFGATVGHLPQVPDELKINGDAPTGVAALLDVADAAIGEAYGLLPLDRYRLPDGRLRVHLQASRGCDRTCLYCPYIRTLGRWSGRSPAAFAADVRALRRLGVEAVQFRDQDFASDADHAVAVADAMADAGEGRISWAVEGNLDQFTPEILAAMRNGGAVEVIVGIESFDPQVLRAARRKVVTDTSARMADVNAAGLAIRGLFIVGLPEDTWARVLATVESGLQLPIHAAQFNVYAPLPGERFGTDRVATVHDFASLGNDFQHRSCTALSQKEVRLAAGWAGRAFAADRAGDTARRDHYLARLRERAAQESPAQAARR
jgi:hypothetical protein